MRKGRVWIWGLFFICAAALIICSQLGYFAGVGMVSLVLTVLLAAVILQSVMRLNFFGILVPLAFVAIIYAKPLGIEAITPWPVLIAAVFAAIGLSILFRKWVYAPWRNYHAGPRSYTQGGYHGGSQRGGCHVSEGGETVENISDDVIDSQVSFGASSKYVYATNLEKATFGCRFGALKVYFDQATLSPNGADVFVDVSFGAIEMYVPRDWSVIDEAGVSLGGIDNKTHPGAPLERTIRLKGEVSLGGIEIKYI